MSYHNYKAAAVKYLYAFRSGQFYQPEDDILEYLIENKAQIISEILKLPLGCRINQGALVRKDSFKEQYNSVEWIKELSVRSWRYFGSTDNEKNRITRRLNSINHQLLLDVVSDFLETSLKIEVKKLSLSIYGGYLWNERPNDLDVLAIIEDKSLSIVEVGGWSTQPVKIFADTNKAVSVDISAVGAGAINSTARNHDLLNILGWYSGGGVTLCGIPPLTIPMPDFKVAYIPLVTLGFCFKELMSSKDNWGPLVYRIDECWKIINWLNKLYPDKHFDHPAGLSFKEIDHSQAVTLLLKQSVQIHDRVSRIADKIKQASIESLNTSLI